MSFAVTITKFEAIPLSKDPAKVLIRWDIAPTRADLRDYEFYIDRGDGIDQLPAFQHVDIDGKTLSGSISTSSTSQHQIAGPIPALDFLQFMDYTPLLRNLQKLQFYRIRLRKISTQEEIGTRPFSWQGDLDLVGLYIAEEHNFLLEDAVGVPCLVYVRRRGGVPCESCFDPIQKKRLQSHCQRCYGTNWVGGFFPPIDAYVDFSPSPQNTVIREWGESQPNETDMMISNYPEVSNGDIIRELRENRLWRVTRCTQTEKRRTPMLQFVRVVEINPGDVEYKIPIEESFLLQKISEFEEIRKKREF